MKESADLVVVDCGEVVTLAGGRGPRRGREMDDVGVVPRGAVAVRDGTILAVDAQSVIDATYDAPVRLSAGGGTLLPGFCDVHTHPVFAATREGEFDMRARGATYQEITAAGGGIFSSVRALRGAAGRRAALLQRVEARLDRFLASGTTSIEAKSGYGLDLAHELLSLELLAEASARHPVDVDPTCLAAHQVPPEWRHDRPGYVRLVVDEIFPAVERAGLARSADVFCDEGAFTLDESRAILEGAREQGFALRVHADELAAVGASELAASLGAQTADHLVRISDAGIAALAAAGTTAVLLPSTCFSLRIRDYAPFARLREAGVPVAIASDFNPGTSYCTSMIEVIALACSLLGMTVAEALTAATRNAAETLGLPGVRGRIEPGAVADLAVLDVENHLFLGYQLGSCPVTHVIKHGRIVWRRGAAQRL